MYNKRLVYILIVVLVACVCNACLNKKATEVTTSNDATLSYVIMASSSFPGLAKADWTIMEFSPDSGLVYNVDSLPFGTRIDSVVTSFGFNHKPAWAVFYASDTDSVYLSTADTLNFSLKRPRLYARSSDNTSYQRYFFQLNVHKVNPDLFQWNKLTDRVFEADGADQKLCILEDEFAIFVNNGFGNRLYTSTDAVSWKDAGVPFGLPDDCRVEQIVTIEDYLLAYAEGTSLYFSLDGRLWLEQDYSSAGFIFESLLFYFNDHLWAVVSKGDKRYLAFGTDEEEFTVTDMELDDTFPAYDFAAVTFFSASERPRALILGGYSPSGQLLNSRWNLDYSPTAVRDSFVYRLYNYSIARPEFAEWGGASIVYYWDRLYMFGGVTKDMVMTGATLLESFDEGVTWSVPDTAVNCLPAECAYRWRQSAVVADDNYLYLVGGQNMSTQFSDVYRGRLNKTAFLRQDGDK